MMKVFYGSGPIEVAFVHFDVQNLPPAAADCLGAASSVFCGFVLTFSELF